MKSKTFSFFTWIAVSFFLPTGLLIVWRGFQPTTLLFDQFLLITILVLVVSLIYLKFNIDRFHIKEQNQLVATLMSITIALSYFSVVQYYVLTVDRSRSIFILNWVDKGKIFYGSTGVTVLPTNLEEMKVVSSVGQRINEHRQRGLIGLDAKGRYNLTYAGKIILKTSEATASIFNLNGWRANTLK
jgi:hypothetical protein